MSDFLELKFGDGDYIFALNVPQILELQRACGTGGQQVGIFTIYGRVLRGRYMLDDGTTFGAPHESDALLNDIFETIRLSLIGGGKGRVNGQDVVVSPGRARELLETYCHPPAPLKGSWDIAAAVLSALIEGYEAQKKSQEPESEIEPAKPPKVSTKRKSSPTAP